MLSFGGLVSACGTTGHASTEPVFGVGFRTSVAFAGCVFNCTSFSRCRRFCRNDILGWCGDREGGEEEHVTCSSTHSTLFSMDGTISVEDGEEEEEEEEDDKEEEEEEKEEEEEEEEKDTTRDGVSLSGKVLAIAETNL